MTGCVAAGCILLTALPGLAETCSTQSQIPAPVRDVILARSRQLAQFSITGGAEGLKSASVPDLANSFGGVEEAVAMLKDDAKATVTVTGIFLFEATQAQSSGVEGAAQFYCGVYNMPGRVTLTLSGLPPGRYALVLTNITGVEYPRHLSFVLQDVTAPAPATTDSWKLAGLINRPMTYAGHDGLYFWKKAREYAKGHELWNASVYFELARQLVLPVGFLSSANSEKLADEQQTALPADWPTAARPLVLKVDGRDVDIASINPAFLQDDPMISVDTVATPRNAAAVAPSAPPPGQQVPAAALAQALVGRVPELKAAFAGVFIHAQGDAVTGVVPMKSL